VLAESDLVGDIWLFIDIAAFERCSNVSFDWFSWGVLGTNIAAISFFFCNKVERENGKGKLENDG